MKVVFFCSRDESDVYDFPDDTSEEDLSDAAADWLVDNVSAGYEIIEEE